MVVALKPRARVVVVPSALFAAGVMVAVEPRRISLSPCCQSEGPSLIEVRREVAYRHCSLSPSRPSLPHTTFVRPVWSFAGFSSQQTPHRWPTQNVLHPFPLLSQHSRPPLHRWKKRMKKKKKHVKREKKIK